MYTEQIGSTIGEIQPFAGNKTPGNWMPCEGQSIDINDNPLLFNVLGPRYGGDGHSTFQLPRMAPLNVVPGTLPTVRYFICVDGTFPTSF